MTFIEKNGLQVSRRGFLAGAGGLTFAVAFAEKGLNLLSPAEAATSDKQIGAWVRIAPDSTVTILTPGAEMGQGSMTGVIVPLAEEMDADWDKVSLEWAPADADRYGYERGGRRAMAIVGSRAVMLYYNDMRTAGAQVRKVLMQAAARKWDVNVGSVKTEPGAVVHPSTGRRLSYGEIAQFAAVPDTLPSVSRSDLKKPEEFRLIGKAVDRQDIPLKVDGSAEFAIDVHVPGMVYASTVHSPVQGAEPVSWNEAEVRAMKGVSDVVKLKEGVAVVADTFEHVLAARNVLQVKWSSGVLSGGFDSETALDRTYPQIAEDASASTRSVKKKGDFAAAASGASRTYKGTFKSDMGYHAQMEPLNGVARFNPDGTLEVWEGTQAPSWSRRGIAKALGLRPDQVIHHQQYMGGGFGRRSRTDYTIEAAQVAKAVEKPVKMIWTREEDIAYGMFRPQTLQTLEAVLDGDGKVAGWRQTVIGDGGNLTYGGIKLDSYYGIPNQDIAQRGASHGVRLKHWRAVAHPFNLFAIEGLVDEMAAAEGEDPIAFRRQRLALTPKAKACFDRVEQMCDWKAKRPAGRALGVSVSERSGSIGAGVVEISLDRDTGKIRVHNVWVAVHGGTIVNPEMARRNIESGVIYGMSSVLKERATVKGGAVQQSNFHDYEVLRMSEAPESINVEFIDSNAKPTGLGEIGNPFLSAAIANAFHALTGKRLYHMPFTPARVKEALKA